jgi:hypothetical protein
MFGFAVHERIHEGDGSCPVSTLQSNLRYARNADVTVQAQDHDEEKKHVSEIEGLLQKCAEGLYSERVGETEEQTLNRALRDPEIAVRATISFK